VSRRNAQEAQAASLHIRKVVPSPEVDNVDLLRARRLQAWVLCSLNELSFRVILTPQPDILTKSLWPLRIELRLSGSSRTWNF